MSKVLRFVSVVALLLAPLILAGAAVVDGLLSTEVLVISPKPPEVVRVEQELWQPGQPVAEIYGVPAARPLRVVLPDQRRLIQPREDPALLLLQVDRAAGEHPLQTKTVWFFGSRAALALSICGFLGLVSVLLLERRWWQSGRRHRPRASATS